MRRPNNGRTLRIENKQKNVVYDLDNRWISTFCAYLLVLLFCHINVECVGFISAVKYLFKYIFKGHDSAYLELVKDGKCVYNEIKKYIDGRYVN